MQDWKAQEQYARVENAGLENAAPICRGRKCGTIEYGKLVCEEECQSKCWKAKMTLICYAKLPQTRPGRILGLALLNIRVVVAVIDHI